jgi:stage II sporulation protein D
VTTAAGVALAILLTGVAAGPPPEVSVRVLSRNRPASVEVSRPGESHVVEASGGILRIDGRPVSGTWTFPAGRWHVGIAGSRGTEQVGAVSVTAAGGEVAIVVRMALEDHVAAVVAAETDLGTPIEALKALAVVARSFAASARGRHADADLCDLAHCQVMRAVPAGTHRAAARAATRATAGRVLRAPSGDVAVATFHAACGGHTADPAEVFGGEPTGAAAVADPGCPESPWEASVPEAVLSRVAGDALSRGAGAPVPAGSLRFLRGQGGFVVQVTDGTRRVGGESFARALDRALGHGRIRSARLGIERSGGALRVAGTGIGHGVGLCQAGAATRAARGEGYEAILRHYFPGARLGEAPSIVTSSRAEPPAPRSAPLNRTSSR